MHNDDTLERKLDCGCEIHKMQDETGETKPAELKVMCEHHAKQYTEWLIGLLNEDDFIRGN